MRLSMHKLLRSWQHLPRVAIALSMAGLSACTTLGPDYAPPQTVELPSSWSQSDVADQSRATEDWWTLFNDPVLNELIELSAKQNLSLEAAGLRIVQARAALGISDALIFPQRQQVNGNLARLYQNENSFNSASIGLDVGWEMDIWGKYARGIESAEANLYASIASYRNVLVSLTAEVARNYISYRTAQERAFLSRQNIEIQERVVAMTQVQFDSGNVSELDVQQAKTQLFATQSALPGLTIARIQSRNALAVLLGTRAEELEPVLAMAEKRSVSSYDERLTRIDTSPGAEERFMQDYNTHSIIPIAPPISMKIDAQLLMQRPDLQVAELQAQAQSARIGATQANLYPQFFLAGSIGLSDTVRSGNSFSFSDSVTAAVGPGFSWNIFQYDRIKNQVRIEDARFQESLTNYNQQVLEAIREVSNALEGYRYTLERSEYDYGAVRAAIRAFNISANQYNNGLVTYQRLLSTVEKMTLREDVYAQTRGSIATQIVALYKALGGGWEPFTGAPIVRPATVEQMRNRTDWGEYLDPNTIIGDDRNE